MIYLSRACRGRTAVHFPASSSHSVWCGVGTYITRLGRKRSGFPLSLTDGYAILMSPSKGETAVHGGHCPRDMAVRMREVMARPWVGVCVPLALSLHYFQGYFR